VKATHHDAPVNLAKKCFLVCCGHWPDVSSTAKELERCILVPVALQVFDLANAMVGGIMGGRLDVLFVV
jgi:hypothetical protein